MLSTFFSLLWNQNIPCYHVILLKLVSDFPVCTLKKKVAAKLGWFRKDLI